MLIRYQQRDGDLTPALDGIKLTSPLKSAQQAHAIPQSWMLSEAAVPSSSVDSRAAALPFGNQADAKITRTERRSNL